MEFTIKTSKREEIINITAEVEKAVEKITGKESKKIKEGKACLVYVPHSTCAIIINENYDENVCQDILNYLKKQIPQGIWLHDKIDGNADAHIKSSLIGSEKIIPIEKGKIGLGKWQAIALAEFDGPRERKVKVEILS